MWRHMTFCLWQIGHQREWIGVTSHRVLMFTAGFILAAASVAKGYELSTTPVFVGNSSNSRIIQILIVDSEFILATWLISGIRPRASRLLAILFFAFFALVSLYKSARGDQTCNCFGNLSVNPRHMFLVDITILLLLLVHVPIQLHSSLVNGHSLRLGFVIVMVSLIGLPGTIAMTIYTPAGVNNEGKITSDADVVTFDPRLFIGKPFPLLQYIDCGHELSNGKWYILLYHQNCPRCSEEIKHILQLSRISDNRRSESFFALVEIPPIMNLHPVTDSALGRSDCRQCSILGRRKWLIETPIIVILKDGTISRCSTSFNE